MLKGLKTIHPVIAFIMMIIMIVAGITIGNGRAVERYRNDAEKELVKIQEPIANRIGKSANIITVAKRYKVNNEYIKELTVACAELEKAKTPSAIAAKDSDLEISANKLYDATINAINDSKSIDVTLLKGVMDDMDSYASILRQQAKTYNEKVKIAQSVYDKQLMRFLLDVIKPAPDLYGIN